MELASYIRLDPGMSIKVLLRVSGIDLGIKKVMKLTLEMSIIDQDVRDSAPHCYAVFGVTPQKSFELGHLWCWSGVAPPTNHLSVVGPMSHNLLM